MGRGVDLPKMTFLAPKRRCFCQIATQKFVQIQVLGVGQETSGLDGGGGGGERIQQQLPQNAGNNWGFPKMVGFPNNPMGFPTKNDHFGV